MTTFDDRERAFEAKFARDQELQFRVLARRDRLIGLWAAAQLGLPEHDAEAYVAALVHADFARAGDEDLLSKLRDDFAAAGLDIDASQVGAMLDEKMAEARRQLIETMD